MDPKARKKPEVIIVGHLTHDHYGPRTRPGGCAFYGGQVYQQLGAHTQLLTSTGHDFRHWGALEPISHVASIRSEKTTTFTNLYREDATRVQHLSAQARQLEPQLLSHPAIHHDRAHLLHLAPVLDEINLRSWVLAGRRRARLLALSVQGFTRTKAPGGTIQHHPWRPTPKDLDGIHFAFLSEEDLTAQDQLLQRLKDHIPIVILTRGERGATIYAQKTIHIPASPALCVDPTGAGDTFAAAFLHAQLTGHDLEHSGLRAAAAAAITVQGQGPETLHKITPQQIHSRLAKGVRNRRVRSRAARELLFAAALRREPEAT